MWVVWAFYSSCSKTGQQKEKSAKMYGHRSCHFWAVPVCTETFCSSLSKTGQHSSCSKTGQHSSLSKTGQQKEKSTKICRHRSCHFWAVPVCTETMPREACRWLRRQQSASAKPSHAHDNRHLPSSVELCMRAVPSCSLTDPCSRHLFFLFL